MPDDIGLENCIFLSDTMSSRMSNTIKLSSAISLKRIADSLEKIEKHLYTMSQPQKNEVELAISRRDAADVNK